MIYGIEYENSGWGSEDELERAAWIAKHEAPLTGDWAHFSQWCELWVCRAYHRRPVPRRHR